MADGEAEIAAHHYSNKFSKSLLERFATARAPHDRRLQPSARRFAGQWNDQRPNRGIARLHARVDLARRERIEIARRGRAQMARRWRHSLDHRLVQWRWLPCRLR